MAHMDQVRISQDIADVNSQERVRLATEVFHKYHREIRAMIQAVVSNPGEADDLFQNLFLSLVAKPQRDQQNHKRNRGSGTSGFMPSARSGCGWRRTRVIR